MVKEGTHPPLAAFIGAAIVEWHKRYGEKGPDGNPQADTAQSLAALADVAGELVSRLPTRELRRMARSKFEARFRKAHSAIGRG